VRVYLFTSMLRRGRATIVNQQYFMFYIVQSSLPHAKSQLVSNKGFAYVMNAMVSVV
jgi:hypothetical protein